MLAESWQQRTKGEDVGNCGRHDWVQTETELEHEMGEEGN